MIAVARLLEYPTFVQDVLPGWFLSHKSKFQHLLKLGAVAEDTNGVKARGKPSLFCLFAPVGGLHDQSPIAFRCSVVRRLATVLRTRARQTFQGHLASRRRSMSDRHSSRWIHQPSPQESSAATTGPDQVKYLAVGSQHEAMSIQMREKSCLSYNRLLLTGLKVSEACFAISACSKAWHQQFLAKDGGGNISSRRAQFQASYSGCLQLL